MERESRNLEYKLQEADFRGIAKTVAAFANGDGGRIVIGVDDNGRRVVGLDPEVIDQLLERLPVSLANALFHRQYSISGATKVALYADRLEIFSPGHFAGPFIPESPGDGTGYIRNRVIAHLARRLRLIENTADHRFDDGTG
jgi:predicted HTH transcriptional regulator